MIRTVAALLAKKTAIVAITGVTVIGGATFALAVEGGTASTEDETTEVTDTATADDCTAEEFWNDAEGTCDAKLTADDCTAGEVLDEDTNTCDAEVAEENCDVAETTDVVETCEPDADPDPADCDIADTTDVVETCEPKPDAEDEPEVELEDDGDEVVKDNHGAAVSQAAKGGAPCEGVSGREKGQCVANVATKGKKAPAEEDQAPTSPDEPAAEEPVVEAQPEEPAAQQTVAPVEKPAKPEHADNGNSVGNGKGKGPKG
jgi:hypothetical protein